MSGINAAASSSTVPAAATTVRSLDSLHTHLPRDAPAQYLTHQVVSALLRQGFEGAEAGALAEIERLLEHHVQALFKGSRDYARLAGRATPNAFDLFKARDELDYSSFRRLRREAKRRRQGVKLERTDEPHSPTRPMTLQDLPPLRPRNAEDADKKPDLSRLDNEGAQEGGIRPIYGIEGGPALPPKWTYPAQTAVEVLDDVPHGQITKRSLDFVKLTASERGDIPAELGVVNYRKQRRKALASGGN